MASVPTLSDLSDLATQAAEIVRAVHEAPHEMGLTFKPDRTPLTAADRGVHDLVVGFMAKRFSCIPVIGEEGKLGKRSGAPDEYWLSVDEVDGTWPFMLGIPAFTSMFALMRGNEPVAAVIVDPIGRKLYAAERGSGCYLNGTRVRVSDELPTMPNVAFVSWPGLGQPTDMALPGMMKVVTGLHDMGCLPMSIVSIGYMDALVACGKIQGTIFPGQTLHDTAAGHLLVEEAGGRVSDLRGNKLTYDHPPFGHIFACTDDFHEKLVELAKIGL